MGFMFRKPEINTVPGSYRTDGLVDDVQMLTTASKIYMGQDLVYPYTPFSQSGMVAWWRGDINVTTTSSFGIPSQFVSWDTYYSSTTGSFTLTGSSSNVEYTQNYVGGSPVTGSAHRAVYEYGNYIYADMNNVFDSSSDITIITSGRIGRGLSATFKWQTWFGMEGDWTSHIGIDANGIGNTNYILKRDEDSTPGSTWFPQGVQASNVTAISYNGTTGDYSYWQDFGTATSPISGTTSGASGRLGSTQQLRLGYWDGTTPPLGATVTFDIIVLDYIPSSTELQLWGSYAANNYLRVYS